MHRETNFPVVSGHQGLFYDIHRGESFAYPYRVALHSGWKMESKKNESVVDENTTAISTADAPPTAPQLPSKPPLAPSDDEVPEFKENLVGRLRNFPLSVEKPLFPLFEAVSNSIHAIEDLKRKDKVGEITIRIHHNTPSGPPLIKDVKPTEPICGFTIEDTGIGFTKSNFASFCTADSLFKKARGGKGVGRLSWLKVFQNAKISSVFMDDSQKLWRRTFEFGLGEKPIVSHTKIEVKDAKTGTTISLIGFHPEYQKNCPKTFDTIARKLIEHFLTMFVMASCPKITLTDSYEDTTQTLNEIFQRDIGQHGHQEPLTVQGKKFKIQHFKIATLQRQPEHQLHFCALSRSVETRDVSKLLTNLKGPLKDETKGSFAYAAYVSGDLLDETVNQERTRLDLLHENTILENETEPTREALMRELTARSERFLEPYLTPIKAEKLGRFKEYIQKRAKFRPLMKLRPDWLDQIRADVTDEELDIELYKLMHRLEIEVRVEGQKLQNQQSQKAGSVDDHKKKFEKYLEESNQVGFSKLADYVIHRRAVIDFLTECMKLGTDGKYRLEEVVHDVIFPMKATSNDIPDPDQSNLWMIDERLSYHYYLSSDLDFRSTGEIQVPKVSEKERVDILVLQPYDRPHAFVGTTNLPFDSITLIEFKRPNRNDYSEDDEDRDPVAQVWRYADKIQKGLVKDKNGIFVKAGPGTQYYAYIVCNITPKILDLAKFHSFTPMPDGLGHFHWQPNYRIYTEILDYQKIIQDAKKRNEVFFDKFNLPPLS